MVKEVYVEIRYGVKGKHKFEVIKTMTRLILQILFKT